MTKGSKQHIGIFMENGSGGFMNVSLSSAVPRLTLPRSDLTFKGGAIGMRVGSQQYTARTFKCSSF